MEFTYTAINRQGTQESDAIEATSYHDAVNVLHQRGLIPTEIKQKSQGGAASFLNKIGGVSLTDKILFIQNLSIMLKAGISLTKSVKILSVQTKNSKFKGILEQVHSDLESGKSLGDSLDKHPEVFEKIFVSMVRVGELSGNLDKSLEYLAVQLQREHDIISKTRGAMIYPSVIVFAIVVIGLLLIIFVLPSLIGIFKDSGVPLPVTTRMVIGLTDFVSHNVLLVVGGLVGFVIAVIAVLRTRKGMEIFDKALLITPVLGEISKKINMARFARIMSSMLKSGTPILEGLQVAGESLGNTQYRVAVAKAAQDVKVGKSIAASLEQYPKLFSYLITQMIGVGEESGTVDSILDELALHFEADVDDTMKNLSSIIEPILILVIGTVVGILAVALISPIYSITQQAGQ